MYVMYMMDQANLPIHSVWSEKRLYSRGQGKHIAGMIFYGRRGAL